MFWNYDKRAEFFEDYFKKLLYKTCKTQQGSESDISTQKKNLNCTKNLPKYLHKIYEFPYLVSQLEI